MFKMTAKIILDDDELEFNYIRAPGPGGQNVNKVATAVQLRFNVLQSTQLSETTRNRLLTMARNKISLQGDLIIKASRYRTQARNKQDALDRLRIILQNAEKSPKKRRKTKPTKAATERRLTQKKLHSKNKSLRGSFRGPL